MSFQTKNFLTILLGMINRAKATQDKITDFRVGSVARTLLEAPAAEIDELYQNMWIGLKEAIPVATFTSFGFDAIPASGASGTLTFSRLAPATTPVIISAGTAVTLDGGGDRYLTQVDAIIDTGQTQVSAMAYCETTGTSTNVPALSLVKLAAPIPGVDAVTNMAAFANGRDAETDEERKARFQGYISTLPRGTIAAVSYGARSAVMIDATGQITEFAKYAVVVEPYLEDANIPVGLVDCYIHNGVGDTSVGLIAEAQRIIDGYRLDDGTAVPGWKAAGVIVNVAAAQEVPIAIAGAITVHAGVDEAAAIADAAAAAANYLVTLNIGADAIRSEIIAQIMSVPGIYNVALTLPAADVGMAINQKAMPSTITLT